MMTPKQMYYGSIPIGKYDYYRVRITDPNIHSLVVVLNSESGDAELQLLRQNENEKSTKEGRLISISYHDDYIPDVIRITPKRKYLQLVILIIIYIIMCFIIETKTKMKKILNYLK